jgi:hypothetical protein
MKGNGAKVPVVTDDHGLFVMLEIDHIGEVVRRTQQPLLLGARTHTRTHTHTHATSAVECVECVGS